MGEPFKRLTRDQFLPLPSLPQTYHQELRKPVEVHWHEFYELLLTVGGSGLHLVNGAPSELTRGQLALLTPADFHELVPAATVPLELFNVVFSDDLLNGEVRNLLLEIHSPRHALLDGADLEEAEAGFRRLWREASERRLGYRRVIQVTLERILIDLARRRPGTQSIRPDRRDNLEKVQKGIAYLHHHFREPLTLAGLAGHAGLSPHYFSECFHRATGVSFQAYLRNLRLHFARSLLQVSEISVTEACLACGFASLSHFERAFRRSYGRSPRADRAELRRRENGVPPSEVPPSI